MAHSTDKASKPDINPDKLPIKQLAYGILVREGVSNEEACKSLNYHPATGYNIRKNIRVHNIVDNKRINRAVRSHDKLLQGKAFGDVKDVKASDVNRCIDRVLERSHPVKQVSIKTILNVTGSPSELADFQGSQIAPIDVTPTTTGSGELPGTTTGRGGEGGGGED